LLVYRQTSGDMVAMGLIANVSLREYGKGSVKRHERTFAKTTRKMAKYMRRTRLFGNPVALAHRPNPAVAGLINATTQRAPDESFPSIAGLQHELWLVDVADGEELLRSFRGPLYVTDGHHRLAAARRVAEEGGFATSHMPAGLFAATELRVAAFARCVDDPTMDAARVIDRLRAEHHLEEVAASQARPTRRHEYGVKIRDRHFILRIGSERIPVDPYESLDVNLLQSLILGPVFDIENPQRDKRLRFVADTPTVDRSDLDTDAWFLPTPASVEDVMNVADSGRVMPPKSTWFGPKLPGGIVIETID
jgi:uncharacterized protein (DUF1015 family)